MSKSMKESMSRLKSREMVTMREEKMDCPKCDYSGEPDADGKCPECGAKMVKESVLDEADGVDVKKVIKALGDTDWGKDNEAQMKAVQLLKGIATSDDPMSNKFMVALSDASTGIAKKLLGEKE